MLHVPYRTDICSTIPGIFFFKKHIIIINIRYCKQTSLFICKYISIYEYISCVCVDLSSNKEIRRETHRSKVA